MKLNLTKAQEQMLIKIGFDTLVSKCLEPEVKPRNTGRKWTHAQRKKFVSTMRKKWQDHKGN